MRFSSPWKDCFFQEESTANHCKSWVDVIWAEKERKEERLLYNFNYTELRWYEISGVCKKPIGWKGLNLQFLYKTSSQCMGYHLRVRTIWSSYSSWVSIRLRWNFSYTTSYLGNPLTLLLILSLSYSTVCHKSETTCKSITTHRVCWVCKLYHRKQVAISCGNYVHDITYLYDCSKMKPSHWNLV